MSGILFQQGSKTGVNLQDNQKKEMKLVGFASDRYLTIQYIDSKLFLITMQLYKIWEYLGLHSFYQITKKSGHFQAFVFLLSQ